MRCAGALTLGRPSRVIIGAAIALLAFWHTPSLAQSSADQTPAPTAYNIDANGVDLITGEYILRTTDVTIGGEGGGLSYGRYTRNAGYYDDFVSTLTQDGTKITVTIGALSDEFTTGTPLSTIGTGATLTPVASGYLYTTRDGVIYTFANALRSAFFWIADARVQSIVWPNGRRVELDYLVHGPTSGAPWICDRTQECRQVPVSRLRGVSSNDGYRLLISYLEPNLPISDPENPLSRSVASKWMIVANVVASNDAVEHCTHATCPAGGVWPSIRYDWNAGVETRTDAENRQTVITYDGQNRITSVRRSGPGTTPQVSLTYNGDGRVQTVTIGSSVWTYAYATSGTTRTTTVTNPAAPRRAVVSDTGTRRITSDEVGTGLPTLYSYDAQRRLTRVTFPEENAIAYTYDARSNVTAITRLPKAPAGGSIVTSIAYPTDAECLTLGAPRCNKPRSVTDPLGRTTNYDYTAAGEVERVTLPAPTADAARPQVRYRHEPRYAWYKGPDGIIREANDPIRQLEEVSQCAVGRGDEPDHRTPDCLGLATETRTDITYGAGSLNTPNNLLPRTITTRAGDSSVSATQAMAYDAVGNLVEVDGPLAGADVTVMRYNRAREQTGMIGPLPGGVDQDGQPLKRRATRIVRNPVTGLVERVDQGTVEGTSDADWANFAVLQQVTSAYDPVTFRKLVDVFSGGGTPFSLTQYSYDAALRPKCTAVRVALAAAPDVCQQLQSADGYDQVAEMVYDGRGLVGATRENGVDVATYGYTDNGRVASLTDARGNATTYAYDDYDRLEITTYPGGSREIASYDAADNIVTEVRRSTAAIYNQYDALDRLISRTPSAGPAAAVTYGYDNFGRLTAASGVPVGASGSEWASSAAYGYDALGRLRSQTVTTAGGGPHTLTMGHDAAGRRTRLAWWDGFAVAYDHLLTGEVSAIGEEGGPTLGTYTYDNLGQRRRLVRGNGVVTSYTPDTGSRLVGLADDLAGTSRDQSVALGYNPVGQLKRRTSANDAYAFPDYAPTSQSVTPNPLNQIASLNGAAPSYDGNGNLTSDARGNGYLYNHDNQLVAKLGIANLYYDTAGRLSLLGGTVRFDHDPVALGIVAESTPAGTLTRRYVHGPGIDEPLVWYEGAGTGDRRWYSADERGSVTAITRVDGSTVAINAYDENGVPAKRNLGRFGYTGQAWLLELGLHYYKARLYDPALGRFLQPDPIGYAAGVNLYAYVRGDPVNFTDPLGLHCEGKNGKDVAEDLSRSDCEAAGGTYTPDVRVVGKFDSGGGGGFSLSGFGPRIVPIGSAAPEEAEGVVGAEVVVTGKRPCGFVCELGRFLGIGQIGAAGEAAVRAQFDIGEKARLRFQGRVIVPDGRTDKVISEVKNVSKLSYTRQLRAYVSYSKRYGLRLDVYVRSDTRLTGSLMQAQVQGDLRIQLIPGM